MLIINRIAIFILFIPILVFIILETVRDNLWDEKAPTWIGIIFIFLLLTPFILDIIAQYNKRLRESAWYVSFSSLKLGYFGFVIMLISFNTDITPIMTRWDISMTGLGIAIIAIGMALLMQKEQKPLFEELHDVTTNLQDDVNKILKKLNSIEKKQTKALSKRTKSKN